jgi:peptidoglycan/LPS O-acetylase OafA/YrhL
VTVNHFSEALLPAGFLGVDMFFTLSGYVVTSSLASSSSSSWLSVLWGFYARRMRRLLPALLLCIVATSYVSCIVIQDPKDALETGRYALFGLSNISLFLHSTDYFGLDARHNPFTHTWSLGVEEQFYLVFPLLIGLAIVIGKIGKRARGWSLIFLVATLVAASFASWFALASRYPAFTYYMLPTRFWELGIGSLTFLVSREIAAKPDDRFGTGLSLAAVLVIAIALFAPKNMETVAAAAICFAVCVFIWGMDGSTSVRRLMSNRFLVAVGLLSYSLYLWHWPVITIARYTVGISAITIGPVLALMFALAILSYFVVERPIRYGRLVRRPTVAYAIAAIALAYSFSFVRSFKADDLKKKYEVTQTFDLARSTFTSDPTFSHCDDVRSFKIEMYPPPCFHAEREAKTTIWMFGDSTTWALKSFASEIATQAKMSVAMFSGDSAFPSHAVERSNRPDMPRWEKNTDFYRSVFSYVEMWAQPGDVVLVTANLAHEFCNVPELYCQNGNGSAMLWRKIGGADISINEAFISFLEEMRSFSAKLRDRGISVVLTAPLPRWDDEHVFYCETQWFRSSLAIERCQSPNFSRQAQSRVRLVSLLKLASEAFSLKVYDPFPFLCNETACQFSNPGTSENYWIDQTHLSNLGGKRLAPHFLEFLRNQRPP